MPRTRLSDLEDEFYGSFSDRAGDIDARRKAIREELEGDAAAWDWLSSTTPYGKAIKEFGQGRYDADTITGRATQAMGDLFTGGMSVDNMVDRLLEDIGIEALPPKEREDAYARRVADRAADWLGAGVMSRPLTAIENVIASSKGIKPIRHTIGGRPYDEILDFGMDINPKGLKAGGAISEVVDAPILGVRPELGRGRISQDPKLPAGTAYAETKTGNIGLSPKDKPWSDTAKDNTVHELTHQATNDPNYPVGGNPSMGGMIRETARSGGITKRNRVRQSPEYKARYEEEFRSERAKALPNVSNMMADRNAQVAAQFKVDQEFLGQEAIRQDTIRDLSDFQAYESLTDERIARISADRRGMVSAMEEQGMAKDEIQDLMESMPLTDPSGIADADTIDFFERASKSMSAKETAQQAREAGKWHPLGKTKLNKSIDEHTRKVDNDPNVPESFEPDWDELIENKTTFLSATGDRSQYGGKITEAGGIPFENPVTLEGGADFMKRPDASWASNKARTTTLQKRIKEAQDAGRDPVMAYAAMAHGPTDFNKMMSDTFFEMMKGGNISKSRMDKFDRAMRKRDPRWQGLEDPASSELFHNVGEVRKNFMDIAGQKDFKKFFPDRNEARFAVTEPSLMDVPVGQSGQAMSHPSGNILENPEIGHNTYDTMLEAGRGYQGGIKGGLPSEDFWRDWTKGRRNDPNDKGARFDSRSMDMAGATQDVDAAYVEGLINRAEELRQKAIDPNSPYLSSPKRREAQIGRHGAALPENIIKDIDETGGTSVELFSGQKPSREGYMVASEPNTNTGLNTIMQDATPEDLMAYMRANKEYYAQPNKKMGAWKQGDDLYVEPSEQIMDYEQAMDFGKKTDQIAGFDLNQYPEFEKTMGRKFPEAGLEFDIVPDEAVLNAREEERVRKLIQWLFNKEQRFTE